MTAHFATMRRPWLLLLQLVLAWLTLCAEPIAPHEAVSQALTLLATSAPATRSPPSHQQTGLTYYAKTLFTQLFLLGPPSSASSSSQPPSEPIQHALTLLQDAAEWNYPDAIYTLAEINFHGNYSLPRNFTTAFRYYEQLAHLNGNATAQHKLGFLYATGLGGAVDPDQAKALLYYTFAAESGSTQADMAVAYRYHAGISSPRNCDEAVHYYKKVSDRAIEYIRSGPPGGHMIVKDSYRLADEEGGVYGEGASVSSSGLNARGGAAHSDAHASFGDVVEYLDLMSRKGDLKATFSLAKLYYDGSSAAGRRGSGEGMRRDLRLARQYFLEVARVVWPKKGPRRGDVTAGTEKLASKAAGFLGRMFLRGEGVKQDFKLANVWFERGVAHGDALSQYSMGIMYLNGLVPEPKSTTSGVPDPYRAAEFFLPAADQDLASAQVRLGVLFLDQGDTQTALQYFDHAARNGHIEAYYYLAEMSYQGIGRSQECNIAAAYYKIVAEKAEIIHSSFREANEAYEDGDLQTALMDYLLAAEQGFEAAQANVGWILDQAQPRLKDKLKLTIGALSTSSSSPAPLTQIQSLTPSPASLALIHWTRSAKQQNIDSLLKMGDYYLSSLGTPPVPSQPRLNPKQRDRDPNAEKAAQCYTAAAETLHSAQAYWNLGWMHENGIGIGQDFHLAKRFYDLALGVGNGEAYLPVKLALGRLRVRGWWNRISGGRVRGVQEEEGAKRKSWTEWVQAFLEADAALYREQHAAEGGADPLDPLDEREDWYNAGATPGGDYDDLEFDEDGLIESVMIIGAAALLMILVVYRRRRQEERERERLGLPAGAPLPQQGLQADGGLFPQPGDPNFGNWAAGGVGH